MNEASITSGPSSVNVDLTGHSALVTGAASGIGRACAERLSRTGAAVTVLDLEGDAARDVAEGIGGEPDLRPGAYARDLGRRGGREDNADRACDKAPDRTGGGGRVRRLPLHAGGVVHKRRVPRHGRRGDGPL